MRRGEGRDNSTDSLGSLDQEIRFQKAGALPAKRAPGENQWISLQHHDQYSAQKNGVQFNASGDHKSFVAFQQRNGDQQAIPAEKNEKAESFLRMDVHLKEAPNFSASFRQLQNETVKREMEDEMKERLAKFLSEVEQRAEVFDPSEHKNFREKDDHLAFVTAGSDLTWGGLLQFVYSVQYHYPDSDIGVFDIGLSKEKREEIERFCKVSVLDTYMQFWPKHITNPKLKLWRPILWQMALAHYGHIVYIEPDRFLMTKAMKDYIEHSRHAGITVAGRRLQYSPFVVTNPEMYYFLSVDVRKLQKVSMFDVNMIILHNSQPVRHHFMRYLISCILEEYCVAPPGSTIVCDQNLFTGSQKYANCHRYDLSAINILLDKWFDYKSDMFLVRDIVTAHYDGRDVSRFLRTCDSERREEI
ncbi:uncharacterized protein LOC112555663 isoform X2 [Pomacea canaliculata]|uniref:uncharacterized protein LOC112555663 isoform X2 n=1 Tax=Pomacea canaliculata TaxID=400727 RepID=UPI000D72B4EC|nr:uncharacterized protein LOC112555663 isoform X2 [Pomacea canaliculata]